MPVTTRIEPIADFIEVAVNDTLSPEARSRALGEFARERIEDAKAKNQSVLGRVPPHHVTVDGRSGVSLETVNPDTGVIVAEFELVGEVLKWVGAELARRSPSRSGEYIRGHTLFADGREISLGGVIPTAQEYSFTNTVPYARKIEIGRTKAGRAFVLQVEPRIYERTAQAARARFGNLVKIEFTMRGIVGGYQINQALAASSRGGRRAASGVTESMVGKRFGAGAHNKSAVRFPTIVITPR